MKNILVCAALAVLVIISTSQRSFAQAAEELYQKGIQLEEVKGELEKAIESFKTVVEKFPTNKPVAAKALLHIGRCYERLGRTEAQKAYERIVREFSDQGDVTKEARARLIALGNGTKPMEKPAMTTRQVWAGPGVDLLGGLSRDGRYLSYVDRPTGDLALRDLNTGENRRLTNKGSWADSTEYAESSAISPDGREVAYAWYNNGKGIYDLRVIGTDGSGSRVLYSNEDVPVIWTRAWMPDGKYVLVTLYRKDRSNQLALISYADGSVKILKTFDWRTPGEPASISPDGVWIAYDFPPEEGNTQRDIFLLAADGTKERRILEHPASDSDPVWTPDGKWIIFISDRSGTYGAYAVRVADGKAQGPPVLIKPDIGGVFVKGFTRNGSYYYGSSPGENDVYIATLDEKTGKVLSPPAPVTQRFAGFNFAPDWSPDGKYLAYVPSRRYISSGFGTAILTIRNVQTGEERDLQTKLGRISSGIGSLVGIRWSPDGRLILVSGSDKKGRQGLYLVEVQTGDATAVVQNEPGTYIVAAVWRADGKAILFVRSEQSGVILIMRDVQTGEEKELSRAVSPDFLRNPIVSPDGKRIAFWFSDKARKTVSIKVMTITGEESHEVVSVANDSDLVSLRTYTWTTDGRQILYGLLHFNSSTLRSTSELMRISAEGGEPQKLGLTMEGMSDVRLHPDGQRIALAVRVWFNSELWVMENFLYLLTGVQR